MHSACGSLQTALAVAVETVRVGASRSMDLRYHRLRKSPSIRHTRRLCHPRNQLFGQRSIYLQHRQTNRAVNSDKPRRPSKNAVISTAARRAKRRNPQ